MRITTKINRKEYPLIVNTFESKDNKGKLQKEYEVFNGDDVIKTDSNSRCSWIYTKSSRIYFDGYPDFFITPHLVKAMLPEQTLFQRIKKRFIVRAIQKEIDKWKKQYG